jgi:hypothetical protein
MMRAFLLQQSLLRHLKAAHHDRWEYITMTMFGPGMRNTKRVFKYVFDDQEMQDVIVRDHKFRLRKATLYGAVWLAAGMTTLGMIPVLRWVTS